MEQVQCIIMIISLGLSIITNQTDLKEFTYGTYAEVISYNRKNLERELQNENRKPNRQQSKAKRREEEI